MHPDSLAVVASRSSRSRRRSWHIVHRLQNSGLRLFASSARLTRVKGFKKNLGEEEESTAALCPDTAQARVVGAAVFGRALLSSPAGCGLCLSFSSVETSLFSLQNTKQLTSPGCRRRKQCLSSRGSGPPRWLSRRNADAAEGIFVRRTEGACTRFLAEALHCRRDSSLEDCRRRQSASGLTFRVRGGDRAVGGSRRADSLPTPLALHASARQSFPSLKAFLRGTFRPVMFRALFWTSGRVRGVAGSDRRLAQAERLGH